MKTHELTPGSPAWLVHRAQHFNASDAPAMMGCSPYKTRAQLLRELATCMTPDVDAGTQRLFDDGHRFEDLARPLAEEIIGEGLYPVVGTEGRLGASFDGLTLADDTNWEHKSINDALRAVMPDSGVGGPEVGAALPLVYRVQVTQQMLVSGAGRTLFTASRWGNENELIEARHCWVEPDAELRAGILRGWAQFEADLAAYTPPAAAEPAPVGKAPETLPALLIEVTGQVTASNLAQFKQTALAAIRSVNRTLNTDADFADAAASVKWCADVESRLAAAKQHALSQTASIDALFKTIDDIAAEARAVRLDLDKLVTRRKTEVKTEAVSKALHALMNHIAGLNAEIAPMTLKPSPVDFVGAIKGLRSFDSMQDALDTTLANAKIATDTQARAIRLNLTAFAKIGAGFEFLFADLSQLVHKAADDFSLAVVSRTQAHKDAEAEKVRKAAEAAAQADEAKRIERESDAAAALRTSLVSLAQQPSITGAVKESLTADLEVFRPPTAAAWIEPDRRADLRPVEHVTLPPPPEPATLSLGVINALFEGRLHVDAAGLALLGIDHQPGGGKAKLYRRSDVERICAELVRFLLEVRANQLKGQ